MTATHLYSTTAQVRAAFWRAHPNLPCNLVAGKIRAAQNFQPADTRAAFVDYVDQIARDGIISDALAQKVTL